MMRIHRAIIDIFMPAEFHRGHFVVVELRGFAEFAFVGKVVRDGCGSRHTSCAKRPDIRPHSIPLGEGNDDAIVKEQTRRLENRVAMSTACCPPLRIGIAGRATAGA